MRWRIRLDHRLCQKPPAAGEGSVQLTTARIILGGATGLVLIAATIVVRLKLGHEVAVLWVGALAGISAFLTLVLGFFALRRRQAVRVGGSIERSAVRLKGAASQEVSVEQNILESEIDLEASDNAPSKKG